MIGFEASIDAASKAARDNAGALSMSNGVLSLGSEKARNAATALQDLADKTDSAAASARESGSSWETANGIYTRGRAALVKSAQAMGLTKTEASALADQILKIPNKTTTFKMDKEDAQHDLTAFNAALKASPDTKSVTLKALSASGEQVLEQFGLKVKRLPNGSVTVSTKGGALSAISNIAAALRGLNGRSATTWVYHNVRTTYSTAGSVSGGKSVHGMVGATGGLFTGAGFRHRGYSDGGLVGGHGTETSDSIFAPWLSKNEFVVNARRTRQYLPLLKALNSGKLALGSPGRWRPPSKPASARSWRSPRRRRRRRRLAGHRQGLIVGLTGTRDKIKATAAGPGQGHQDGLLRQEGIGLLKMVDHDTKKLLAWPPSADKVAATIAEAKAYASDVTKNARSRARACPTWAWTPSRSPRAASRRARGQAGADQAVHPVHRHPRQEGPEQGLLKQILNMGPEAGTPTRAPWSARTRRPSSRSTPCSRGWTTATTTLGKVGADRLYDSGKNASKGFLKGLEGPGEGAREDHGEARQEHAEGAAQGARHQVPGHQDDPRRHQHRPRCGRRRPRKVCPHVDRAMEAVAGRMAGRAAFTPSAGRPAVAMAGARQSSTTSGRRR
jgi:hypothetical protein